MNEKLRVAGQVRASVSGRAEVAVGPTVTATILNTGEVVLHDRAGNSVEPPVRAFVIGEKVVVP